MIRDPASFENALASFRGKLDKYQHLLESIGKRVYRSKPAEADRLLATLTEPLLTVMDRRLSIETSVLEQMMAAGEPPNDPKRQLWRFAKANTITPSSDLFDKIEDGDTVQIF